MSNHLNTDFFKKNRYGVDYAGDHILVDLWGASNLADIDGIRRTLEQGARDAGATILHSYYHPFGEGMGVSGVTVLSESHISIHTWPEKDFASIDIFMCGDCDPNLCLPAIRDFFAPSEISVYGFERGNRIEARIVDQETFRERGKADLKIA